MAKIATPWFWEARNAWYVKLNGKRHPLGPHPETARKPVKSPKTGLWNWPQEIDDAFKKLTEEPEPVVVAAGKPVAPLLQSFINWCKANRAKLTTDRYFEFLDSFERYHHGITVEQLNSGHVTTWLDEQKDWGPTTKRNAITALIRAMNWCVKNMGLERNPLARMDKPTAKRRSGIVTPEEFEKILAVALDPLKDLLVVSYDSGARPFEVKELEARHLQLELSRAVIPTDEAKGRKHPRTFYFPTDRCLAVLLRLSRERPEGPLFLNSKGNKWTGDAVKCAFARMQEVLGRRIRHYDLRRTFVTQKIIAGVDSHVVAKLSGHQSTAMIDKHYSCIADDARFMLEQSKKGI